MGRGREVQERLDLAIRRKEGRIWLEGNATFERCLSEGTFFC
jgi:hypothetical protein